MDPQREVDSAVKKRGGGLVVAKVLLTMAVLGCAGFAAWVAYGKHKHKELCAELLPIVAAHEKENDEARAGVTSSSDIAAIQRVGQAAQQAVDVLEEHGFGPEDSPNAKAMDDQLVVSKGRMFHERLTWLVEKSKKLVAKQRELDKLMEVGPKTPEELLEAKKAVRSELDHMANHQHALKETRGYVQSTCSN